MCEGGCECGGMCGLAFTPPTIKEEQCGAWCSDDSYDQWQCGNSMPCADHASMSDDEDEEDDEFVLVLCGCEPGEFCDTCNPTAWEQLRDAMAQRTPFGSFVPSANVEELVGSDVFGPKQVLEAKLVSLSQDRERVLAAMVVLEGREGYRDGEYEFTHDMAGGLLDLMADIDDEIAVTLRDWAAL